MLFFQVPNFAFSLFELDWDVFSVHIEGAINRVPVIETTGIKSTVCGPGGCKLIICAYTTMHLIGLGYELCIPGLEKLGNWKSYQLEGNSCPSNKEIYKKLKEILIVLRKFCVFFPALVHTEGPFILHCNCVAVPMYGLHLCRKSTQHHRI